MNREQKGRSVELAVLALLVASAGACRRTADAAPDAAGMGDPDASAGAVDMAASTAQSDDDGGTVTLTPPDAVVAADPNIPLNEAVVGTPQITADYVADTAPPAQPVDETQPPQPEANDAWIPGYWWWSRPLARYVWVSGAWRPPPPDQAWVPGAWNMVNAHYAWSPGFWGPRGYAREMIAVGPPPFRVDVRPAAPAADYLWTPGFYAYRGGSYAWTTGTWARPPTPGVGWVEPRYVGSGGRFFFQPGRWDFAPEHRGIAYAPNIDVRPGARVTLRPIAVAVIAQHVNFVADSSRAIAHGAIRTPSGAVMVPHEVVAQIREEHGAPFQEHVAVVVDPHAVIVHDEHAIRPDEQAHAVPERVPEVHAEVHTTPPPRVEPNRTPAPPVRPPQTHPKH